MKFFIIDWGKQANGGRFAIIQADDINDAVWQADSIGWPEKIAPLNVKPDVHGMQYIEIGDLEKPFCGKRIEEAFIWKEPSAAVYS